MNLKNVALFAGFFFATLAIFVQGILPMLEPESRQLKITKVVRTDLGELKWMEDDATDYSESELLGRQVYIREGCWYCHSQYVRPVTGERRRWGPVTQAGEYAFDMPHLFSTRRIGPDLSRVGLKYSDEWHLAHFWDPRMVVPDSIMPRFAELFDGPYDGIKVVAQLAHNWTSQVAQKELSQWLSSNPIEIHGIAVQSSGETGTLQALLQSGRDPIPPIALGGELGALCYWRQNPDYIDEAIYAWPPGDEIQLGFEVMMRTLQGQGPKIQSILVGPATKSFDDIAAVLDEDCDRNSTGWDNPGLENWAPSSYVDAFFERPADPTKYDPSSH